ncbi:MAG: hypothetical protein AB7P04_10660 [Bacteriovoracia bacterium]
MEKLRRWMGVFIAGSVAVTSSAGAAAISGKLAATPECAGGQVQTWVSAGQTLLYQADLSVGGTFEFHLNPGKYNVVATGSTGCFVEQVVEMKADKNHEITLNLVSGKRAPSGAAQ